MDKVPEHAVDPITLICPRCKAKPGEACDILENALELMHLERIEAAIIRDVARKKMN
jgi:hypothetical protein